MSCSFMPDKHSQSQLNNHTLSPNHQPLGRHPKSSPIIPLSKGVTLVPEKQRLTASTSSGSGLPLLAGAGCESMAAVFRDSSPKSTSMASMLSEKQGKKARRAGSVRREGMGHA